MTTCHTYTHVVECCVHHHIRSMLSIFYYLYCTQRTHIPSNSCLVNIKITELCKQNKTPKNKNNKKKIIKKQRKSCVYTLEV